MVLGDLIVFFAVGAYTLEQMCLYNGQRRAAALVIQAGGDVQLIRRSDRYPDLIEQDLEDYPDSNKVESE
jgi:hypothetical protein